MNIAVAVTGASGSIYAKRLLYQLSKNSDLNVSLVWSSNAWDVWKEELGDMSYMNLPFKTYDKQDFYAPFASGSAGYEALIVCPCSMGTLARIASGVSNDLITRAADVMLKERKRLICVIRENPYNIIHINNMKIITEAGGIICPASPSFYNGVKNLDDAVDTVVNRILSLAGIPHSGRRWGIN